GGFVPGVSGGFVTGGATVVVVVVVVGNGTDASSTSNTTRCTSPMGVPLSSTCTPIAYIPAGRSTSRSNTPPSTSVAAATSSTVATPSPSVVTGTVEPSGNVIVNE